MIHTISLYAHRISKYCEMAHQAHKRHNQHRANYEQMKSLGNLVMVKHYEDCAYLYKAMSERLENRAATLVQELNQFITKSHASGQKDAQQ